MAKTSTLAVILAALIISVVLADEADAAGLVKRAISTSGQWLHSELPTKTVFTNSTNTYDDTKVQTFSDDDIRFGDNTGGQFYTFSTGDVSANRVVSLPVITTDDTFTMNAATQTLTGKTLDGGSNTFTNIPKSGISTTGTWVAADIPSLDTSKITTGTMATARLGSSTANSTTYLRGDQSWSRIPIQYTFLTPSGAVAIGITWTNQPAGISELFVTNAAARRLVIDTEGFTQFRVQAGYTTANAIPATILVSSDADNAPSVTIHTARSGSISAKLANIQPYEQSNKITKLDKYLYTIPLTSDETFLMVVVTEEKGVSKNTVQAAIHLTSCEGTTVISAIPEEKYEETASSAPKIFDVKFQIENSTQHSSETESEFSYVDNQDLSVSAIVDAQNPLQRSELRITTIGQSQDYVAIKMDVEPLLISNSTYVISATIPSDLMQEPAISYWIHIIDEDQNEAESKQYNIGVKPISLGVVTFEMDIPSIKESGSLVRPQLFVDNNNLPSYGIVSLIVNGEIISKESQLFATGETVVNLEWKSPGVDKHMIYDIMASVTLYDKSISTQPAKLHIYPKTITTLASEIKSLEPITEDDNTILADPALIYASNSVDQNLRFHVIAPNGQCIIGVSEECAINDSTSNQRGGLTSIEYEDQIIRVRYSGPDSTLERFSITSIDPLVEQWIVSLETPDGIIPQAQAMKDLSIKVKYRTHSETITVYSE